MHRSRLAGFIIDCKDTAPDDSARFWSGAFGMKSGGDDGAGYAVLDAGPRDLHLEVQRVSHESRLHLDIETDDQAAEVARLEKLGAKKIAQIKRWTVMEAPTGQRFCVVNANRDLSSASGVNVWP
jgi:hypothetical protein